MKNLYIDFDGVIMDTIKVTYDMVDRLEINREDFEKMSEFYENLNWKKILSLTPIINDAFNNIKKLYECDKFNIAILTHVNSLDEAVAKINYIRKYIKEVTIIPVPREVSKTKMCKIEDAILVDDYSGNLKDWEKEGGIGIQFSTDLNKDKGFKVIDKLDKLIDMF
jgi:hypothetical protein